MLTIALAVAAAASPAAAPERQARATVTILKPAVLRFAEIEASRPAALRETLIPEPDGTRQRARLVEFE